ncbi:MAG: NADH-ubiquinone oxidoreductase-F iron-sulfur binding region domain-containing protein [Pedococcus sp.]
MTAVGVPRSSVGVPGSPLDGSTGRHVPVTDVTVLRGPRLLATMADPPSLATHRERFGNLPSLTLSAVLELARDVDVRGRGGAGFPLATKLAAAGRGRRPLVVVNAAEGEPCSAKDSALAVVTPHRVLDGAAIAARALGTKEIHVVTPRERPTTGESLGAAIAERVASGERLRWRTHLAAPGFVSGQARAVIELLSGRPGLPVTAWQPEAVSGYRGRPTLLSNAETFAQLATLVHLGASGYAALGLPEEPGTVLLTVNDDQGTRVVEVATGTPWDVVLTEDQLDRPLLVGGYHGTWVAPGQLQGQRVARTAMQAAGLTLGAGVVIVPAADECPLDVSAEIVAYLAASTAGRCGPCFNGLPALSLTLGHLASRSGHTHDMGRLLDLAGMVERRGACAHPDGTARLVRSLLTACPDEVARHAAGGCGYER